MTRESAFQLSLKHELQRRFPGCIVLKNDPTYAQGIPDLIVLFENRWAALECKRSEDSCCQPNQEYYIQRMNRMSYASFICPENKERVLDELQQAFES